MALIQNKLYEECSSIIRRHTELRLDSAVSSSWTTASSPTLGRRTSHSSSLFQRPTELISGLGLHLSPKQPSRHNSRAHGHHGGQFPLSASDEQSASLVLALETLHSFDFYTRHPQGAHRVLQTVRDSAIKLLDDEDSYVRKCAAITCCKVLNRSLGDSGFMSSLKMNGSTDNDIFYILERLLIQRRSSRYMSSILRQLRESPTRWSVSLQILRTYLCCQLVASSVSVNTSVDWFER